MSLWSRAGILELKVRGTVAVTEKGLEVLEGPCHRHVKPVSNSGTSLICIIEIPRRKADFKNKL